MYAILRRRCGASLQIPPRRLSFFFFGLMSVLTRCAVAQNRRTVGLLDKYWAEAPGGSPRAGSISRNRVFRPRCALAEPFRIADRRAISGNVGNEVFALDGRRRGRRVDATDNFQINCERHQATCAAPRFLRGSPLCMI